MEKIIMDEIRLDSKDLVFKNNRVNSAVIPNKTDQLKRTVIIEGNTEINGACFGENILIHNGPAEFKRAVFSNDELVVDSTIKDVVIFREAVGANKVVSCTPISEHCLFASDINSNRINLRNCYVGGSLYADEILLDNCIVIGGVFATKQLTINNSIVGTFNSQSVTMSGINYLIYPSAFSVEPINATSETMLYNITLADLMNAFLGKEQRPETGRIKMSLLSDRQRTNLKDSDGTILLVHAYSVAGRVIVSDLSDFEKLNNHFLINAGALSSHLMKTYFADEVEKKGELSLENISEFFFNIIDGRIEIQDLCGEISLDSLKTKLS